MNIKYSILLAVLFTTSAHSENSDPRLFHGINLGGAAMGASQIPGKHGANYLWPNAADVTMYAEAGFNTLRIPFLWERMQPQLMAPLNESELALLDIVLAAAKIKNLTILLDPHNYGEYQREIIGSENVPILAFSDFWRRLSERYKNNPNVIFGLMNEPHRQKADEWAPIAQAAITAIRKTGAKQLILVPGTRYSGAYSWLQKDGNLSNAEALQNIQDPENNYIFELHQYFDGNSSGTASTCVSDDIGVQRLEAVTKWLRRTGHKGLLGEFGASTDRTCLNALKNTLMYMKENQDVWQGWTYWAAAKWFGNYMFNIYPPDAARSPQLSVIQDFLKK